MSVLEIVKPSAQLRIQISNNRCQTISACALASHPNVISKRSEATFTNPAPPRLKPVAQKLKPLSFLPTVPHMGLVSIETEPVLLYPASDFFQRGLRLFSTRARHHKVIGVANHAVALLPHVTIQSMKINVRQLITAPCGVPPMGVHRSISFMTSCFRKASIN